MSRYRGRKTKIGTAVYNHIINNKREYLIITILFFIGLVIAIIFLNNASEDFLTEINTYLSDLFNNIKNYENINFTKIFKKSIIYNITITILLWFGASTIIGIPIVYGSIILKGFSIGYTISCLLTVFGVWKGLLLSLTLLLLHNIIFIPTMFAISVSGIKLYNSIMKNKQRENIKIEILRHTIFCLIMCIPMTVSTLLETYVSSNIGIILLEYLKI